MQIAFTGWQRPYSVDIRGLPSGVQLRVHAIDANNGIAYTSSAVSMADSSSQCSPPRTAPSELQATPIGPTQIRLMWKVTLCALLFIATTTTLQPIAEAEWNCDRLWYIVKYSSPKNQGFKNLTQGENQLVFDSDPFTKWQFQVQAANVAGESAWSRAASGQTQDTGI